MSTHLLTGSAAARPPGSAWGVTGDTKGTAAGGATVKGATVRGAAAEGAVASCAERGDGGAIAAAATAAGAVTCAGGGAADTSGRGEDEEVGDQGVWVFSFLGEGPLGPQSAFMRCCIQLLWNQYVRNWRRGVV